MRLFLPLAIALAMYPQISPAKTSVKNEFHEAQNRKAQALRKPVCRAPLNTPRQGKIIKTVTLKKGVTTRQQIFDEFYEPTPAVGVKIPQDRVSYALAARFVPAADRSTWQIQLLDCVPNERHGMSDGYISVLITFDAKGFVQQVEGLYFV